MTPWLYSVLLFITNILFTVSLSWPSTQLNVETESLLCDRNQWTIIQGINNDFNWKNCELSVQSIESTIYTAVISDKKWKNTNGQLIIEYTFRIHDTYSNGYAGLIIYKNNYQQSVTIAIRPNSNQYYIEYNSNNTNYQQSIPLDFQYETYTFYKLSVTQIHERFIISINNANHQNIRISASSVTDYTLFGHIGIVNYNTSIIAQSLYISRALKYDDDKINITNNNNHRALLQTQQFGSCIQAAGDEKIIIPTHNLTKDWAYPGDGTNDFRPGCASKMTWAGTNQPDVPTMRSGDDFENCSAVSQYCLTNTQTNIISSIEFQFQYSWGYENLDSSSIYSYFQLALVSNEIEAPQLWNWTSPAYNDPLYSWDDCTGQRACYSPLQIHTWNDNINVATSVEPHFVLYFVNQNKNLHILPETLMIKIQWTVTESPTKYPTNVPSNYPTGIPTDHPTGYPTMYPSNNPTKIPSQITSEPTKLPLDNTSVSPTNNPTARPSDNPTATPSDTPTILSTIKDENITTTNRAIMQPTEGDDSMEWVYILMGIIGLLCCILILLLLCFTKRVSTRRRKQTLDVVNITVNTKVNTEQNGGNDTEWKKRDIQQKINKNNVMMEEDVSVKNNIQPGANGMDMEDVEMDSSDSSDAEMYEQHVTEDSLQPGMNVMVELS